MASAVADLRAQLIEVCDQLPPDALERVVRYARNASVLGARGSGRAEHAKAESTLAERMQSFERWRALAEEIGRSLPPGTSLVDTLTELRNERERVLAGEYDAGGEWPPLRQ